MGTKIVFRRETRDERREKCCRKTPQLCHSERRTARFGTEESSFDYLKGEGFPLAPALAWHCHCEPRIGAKQSQSNILAKSSATLSSGASGAGPATPLAYLCKNIFKQQPVVIAKVVGILFRANAEFVFVFLFANESAFEIILFQVCFQCSEFLRRVFVEIFTIS